MNYNPSDYIQKDKFGIGASSRIIGQTIVDIPEKIRQKELREKAINDAKKDWSKMESSYKAIKSQYTKKANLLIQQGLMTQEELNADLSMLRIPTSTDKQNPGEYIDELGKNYGILIKKVSDKERRLKIGKDVRGAFGLDGTTQPQPGQQPDQAQEPTIPNGPQESPPMPGAKTYSGMESNPWGDTPQPGAQKPITQQPMQPGQPQPQPVAQPQPGHQATIPTVNEPANLFEVAKNLPQDMTYDEFMSNPVARTFQAKQKEDFSREKMDKKEGLERDKLEIRKIQQKRRENKDALGWANYKLRAEGLEFSQAKKAGDDWSKKDELAAVYEYDVKKIEGAVNALETELQSLQQQLEDPALYPEDKADIQKNIDKKTAELERKSKEFSAAYKQSIKADMAANDAAAIFQNTLKDTPILSEYKAGQKATLSPAGGTVPVPTIPTKPSAVPVPPTAPVSPQSQNGPRGRIPGEHVVIMQDKNGKRAQVLVDANNKPIRVIREL